VAQVAVHEGREVYAFTRPADRASRAFAIRLGAGWAGGSDEPPPEPLDAAIVFAPVGALVPAALRAVARGGTVVCAGIHMSDIPAFPYAILWGERVVRSVANLTRRDGEEFFALLARVPVRTDVRTYPLAEADAALDDLRHGRIQGAAVLVTGSGDRGGGGPEPGAVDRLTRSRSAPPGLNIGAHPIRHFGPRHQTGYQTP
jgi:propanol-preferring alcohol dehydrogenase